MLSAAEVPNWAFKLLRRDLEAGPQDIAALARFPGSTWLAFLLLHQGITFSALRLVFNSGGISRVAGTVAATAAFAAGAVLVAFVRTGVATPVAGETGFAHVCEWPRRPVGPVVHNRPGPLPRVFLWGNGEWVSRTRAVHWAVRYQAVVRQYSADGAAPGVAAELAAQWGQALASSLPTPTWRQCGHARVVSVLVLLAYATWTLGSRPFRRPCDNVLMPVFLGIQAATSVVQAWAFYSYVVRSEACHELCSSAVRGLLVAASAVLLLKAVLTHAGTATLLLTGRRSHLQQLEWEETEHRERDQRAVRDQAAARACRGRRDRAPEDSPPPTRGCSLSRHDTAVSGLPLLSHEHSRGPSLLRSPLHPVPSGRGPGTGGRSRARYRLAPHLGTGIPTAGAQSSLSNSASREGSPPGRIGRSASSRYDTKSVCGL
eukprot:TRINITY_DN19992_c0_g1_i1.p1 TRINITY_DN19992_c0_g1~~TRINITY_DN19992_c0_g1_i1.p1  ORF type:complete len:431 (+),score=12.86 TRINITY_DN19992_c0_g1_i1:1254-2546(+)